MNHVPKKQAVRSTLERVGNIMGFDGKRVERAIAIFESVFSYIAAVLVTIMLGTFFIIAAAGVENEPNCPIFKFVQEAESEVYPWIVLLMLTPISFTIILMPPDFTRANTRVTIVRDSPKMLKLYSTLYTVQTVLFFVAGLMLTDYIPIKISLLFLVYRVIIAQPIVAYYFNRRIMKRGKQGFPKKSHSSALKKPVVKNVMMKETPPAYHKLERVKKCLKNIFGSE